jgi:hypothetical protein
MRPLNRPMFRYGGPIKEGVMSGIREPKKDGGMLLVGEHPKEFRDAGGREKHVAPLVVGAGLGLARLAPLAMRGARALQGLFGSRKFVKDVGTKIASSKNTAPFTPVKQIFEPNKVGKYIMGSPEYRLITGGAGYAGKAGKKLFEGGKYLAKSPLTVAGGLIYAGGKFFNKDGTPASADAIAKSKASDGGPPGGGDPSMFATPKETSIPQLTAEELRKKNVERYRDIMDIKGMNKDAAYNSLIAASQAINQSGDFKGDIKSGKLINEIIQATSKQFDKPKQTKDAIDTLILKGEIDKDIKASDPSAKLLNEYRLKQMEKIDKELNTGFAEAKIAASKNLSGQSAIDAAASVASENFKGNLLTKTQLTDVMEAAKGSGEISEQDIIISATTEVIKGKNLPDGDYTVGDVLVTIQDGQIVPGSIKR